VIGGHFIIFSREKDMIKGRYLSIGLFIIIFVATMVFGFDWVISSVKANGGKLLPLAQFGFGMSLLGFVSFIVYYLIYPPAQKLNLFGRLGKISMLASLVGLFMTYAMFGVGASIAEDIMVFAKGEGDPSVLGGMIMLHGLLAAAVFFLTAGIFKHFHPPQNN